MDAGSVEVRGDMEEVNQLPVPFAADDVDRLAELLNNKTPFFTRLQLSPWRIWRAHYRKPSIGR